MLTTVKETMCECGALALDDSYDFCRLCKKSDGWHTGFEKEITKQIHAQLG